MPVRAKAAPGFHAEQIAQNDLALALVRSPLVYETLRPRYHAGCRKEIYCHICQPLQYQLPVDDLLAMTDDRAVGGAAQFGDVLLEVILVLPEPLVELDVERRGLTEA